MKTGLNPPQDRCVCMEPGTYRHWTFGGACWLDQDPYGGNDDDADGSFTALQHGSAQLQQLLKNKLVQFPFPDFLNILLIIIILY